MWGVIADAAIKAWDFARAVKDGVREAVNTISGIGEAIKGAASGIGSSLRSAGEAVIDGFIEGMRSEWHRVTDWINDKFSSLPAPVRAVLECAGIHDVLSKSMGSDNAINVVHATVAALKGLEAPEAVAARRGLPLEDVAPAALLRARAAGAGA